SHLTSDNPILFKQEPNDAEDFRSSIILPASKNKTLIRINENVGFGFNHKTLAQDVLIFDQAIKYVICCNKKHLEKVIEMHSRHNTSEKMSLIKRNIFQVYEF